MIATALLAQVTNAVGSGASLGEPGFFARFGLMLLPLLVVSATMMVVIVDRYLIYHR